MEARIEMKAIGGVGGAGTESRILYEPKLRTRDGDLIDNGGIVVISGSGRDGLPLDVNGRIGVLDITPGRETVIVKAGALHCGVDIQHVRPLKMGEMVVNP